MVGNMFSSGSRFSGARRIRNETNELILGALIRPKETQESSEKCWKDHHERLHTCTYVRTSDALLACESPSYSYSDTWLTAALEECRRRWKSNNETSLTEEAEAEAEAESAELAFAMTSLPSSANEA